MAEATIEDRVLIRDLYDRYHWALNTGDPDTVRACFASDATVVQVDGRESTTDHLVEMARSSTDDTVGVTRQHHLTTFQVVPEREAGGGRMAVRLFFLVTEARRPPAIDARWSCRCEDEVVRVDGGWRIQRRRFHLNHPATA